MSCVGLVIVLCLSLLFYFNIHDFSAFQIWFRYGFGFKSNKIYLNFPSFGMVILNIFYYFNSAFYKVLVNSKVLLFSFFDYHFYGT